MNPESDFQAYLKALVETPVNIVFVLLDIVGAVVLIRLVVDDWEELLIVIAFLLVMHGGHYLIFKKQKAVATKLANRIAELEDRQPRLDLLLLDDGQISRHLTMIVPKLPQQPDFDGLVQREAEELEADWQEDQETEVLPVSKAFFDAARAALMQRRKSAEEYKKECNDYLNATASIVKPCTVLSSLLLACRVCTSELRTTAECLPKMLSYWSISRINYISPRKKNS